jgi:two-component system sensor histidine kinase KdpD
LVDLTPEELIARLRAGKVYRPERVPAALNHFFKIENLSALRETALRQVAEDVEVKRLVREPSPVARRDEEGLAAAPEPAPQAISERLLALATLTRDSEHVVRRAWRSAQRLDGELDVLVVRPPGRTPNAEDRKQLEALRRLVSMLGARLRVEEGEDVAAVAIRVARELGSTYVLLGTPSKPRGLGRVLGPARDSLLMRLLDELPGVDVRIVSDPTLRKPRERGEDPAAAGAGSTVVGAEHPGADGSAADFAPRAD